MESFVSSFLWGEGELRGGVRMFIFVGGELMGGIPCVCAGLVFCACCVSGYASLCREV